MAINDPDDTIAAIATAAGEGGIAVVRISGPASLTIVDRIFKGAGPRPSEQPSHVILHGHITGESGDLDEVILLVMKAPHSYTCEDVVEIQGHGGRVAARRILRRVLDAGARLAEAGEFTKRAFLNGRIDLVQAEAVLDLVRAQSDRAAQAALEQLEGSLSLRFNQLFNKLIDVAADFEATLDFEEDELSAVDIEEPLSKLHSAKEQLHKLLATWDEGHLLREGAIIVISGMPNVGKSTMLNLLLGRQRSIVSPIPGTTRDTIEEPYILDGIALRLVDTAGLRTSGCVIEEEGIRRAKAQIEKADAYLYLVDASHPLSPEDADFLSGQDPERCIVVLNKTDLGVVVNPDDLKKFKIIVRSCLIRNEGLVEIREAIKTTIERNISFPSQPHAVISERHRNLLAAAEREISQAAGLIKDRLEGNMVLAAANIRNAIEQIGQATGRVYHAELLQNIFSKFCIGK